GKNAVPGIHEVNDVEERAHRIDLDPSDHCRFPRINLRHNELGYLARTSFDCNRQCATNSTDTAVEGQFADEYCIDNFFLVKPSVRAADAKGHRKIEP